MTKIRPYWTHGRSIASFDPYSVWGKSVHEFELRTEEVKTKGQLHVMHIHKRTNENFIYLFYL